MPGVMTKCSAAKARYDQEGYAVFNEILDSELIQECRDHVDWLVRKHPDTRPEALHTTLVREDPFWVRLVGDERLLDIAGQFIGPDIALFASHYILLAVKLLIVLQRPSQLMALYRDDVSGHRLTYCSSP